MTPTANPRAAVPDSDRVDSTETAAAWTHHDVTFPSGDIACSAWLDLPARTGGCGAAVVMAHGLDAMREQPPKSSRTLSGISSSPLPEGPSTTQKLRREVAVRLIDAVDGEDDPTRPVQFASDIDTHVGMRARSE